MGSVIPNSTFRYVCALSAAPHNNATDMTAIHASTVRIISTSSTNRSQARARSIWCDVDRNIVLHLANPGVYHLAPFDRVFAVVDLPSFNGLSGGILSLKSIDECANVASCTSNLTAEIVEELLHVLGRRSCFCHVLGAAAPHAKCITSSLVGSLRSETRLDSNSED